MRRLVLITLLLLVPRFALAQSARLSLDDEPHTGVPFTLGLVAEGFDESPQPTQPKLEIPGAVVTPMGAQPNVSQSIQIINGRRTDFKSVSWVFRWRVEINKAGRYTVPPLTVVQGSKKATAQGGNFEVESVPTTDDMKLSVTLPDRPVFVGETIEAKLVWLFKAQPQQNPQFSVPLMAMDNFIVSAPPATDPRKALSFAAGSKELQLPYEIDKDGGFNRVTVRFYVAPKQAGKLDVPAASVVAAMPVGRPDFFGNAPSQLMRAQDVARSIEVKPLPETDKPASFAGAVGSQFAISVGTSRSVVQLGEPVELTVTIKSDQRLDTLSLGRLDGPGGLPKDKFTVPADAPTGELSDDGKTKTFKVTAQVTGPANEIPAIAFSYFDPVKGRYQTIHSDPIAVSVKGGSVVGAGDVVALAPSNKNQPVRVQDTDVALVGADLSLSPADKTLDKPLGGALLWLLVGALYLLPLAFLAFRTWQLRTHTQREEASEVKAARKRVEAELSRASKEPARDTAGALVSALRAFARAVDRDANDDGGLFAKIETESFAPSASSSPLSEDLRGRAADLVRRWTAEAKRKSPSSKAAVAILLAMLAAPRVATADALTDGRDAYVHAMNERDATARKAAFQRAATAFSEAVRTHPGSPEVLADWGTAALSAGDVGTATLAYRRALAIDPDNARALRNLKWLRSKQGETFRSSSNSATDTLFFFHAWPRSTRLLAGAIAFALAILLLVPWGGRRRLVAFALVPAAIWIAMTASLVLEDRHPHDAVVMDSVMLRAADSAGAPSAMSQALPRGAEVTLLEARDGWTKIRLANGASGWVPASAVERVR
jgi:cytochrome c-type biogenesis protein CcmH/NrfG